MYAIGIAFEKPLNAKSASESHNRIAGMGMTENQVLPVRVYQTEARIMLTAPMPGLEPEDIAVRIDGTRVVVHGEERGPHQRDVPLVIAESAIGPYHRELDLSEPVDGSLTNATYGNGVLVLSMPKAGTTHGRSGIARMAFGSVAELVVREATVPVLLMRASTSSPAVSRAA